MAMRYLAEHADDGPHFARDIAESSTYSTACTHKDSSGACKSRSNSLAAWCNGRLLARAIAPAPSSPQTSRGAGDVRYLGAIQADADRDALDDFYKISSSIFGR